MKPVLFFSLFLLFPLLSWGQGLGNNDPNRPKQVSDYAKFVVPKVSKGEIRRLQSFPSRFVDARNVEVWLPENYSSSKRYAVLYMHDGQMLFDSTMAWNKQEWRVDETLAAMMQAGKIRETIVVGVWNNGKFRREEYFPQKALAFLSADAKAQLASQTVSVPQADAYLKFLVRELKPFIDRTFSTLPDAANTFIAGSSMGGLISLYAISEYPDVFGGAACISTHWPGTIPTNIEAIPQAFQEYIKRFAPSPTHHKLYFDYGTETLDATYAVHQKKIDAILQAKGYDATNLLTRGFVGDDHSERAWQRRFHIPMQFLLGKD